MFFSWEKTTLKDQIPDQPPWNPAPNPPHQSVEPSLRRLIGRAKDNIEVIDFHTSSDQVGDLYILTSGQWPPSIPQLTEHIRLPRERSDDAYFKEVSLLFIRGCASFSKGDVTF